MTYAASSFEHLYNDNRTVALTAGVDWVDGRSSAACTGKAASCGSGGGGGVAYEARGYKQGWVDGRAGKTGKPTAQTWRDFGSFC